MRRLGEVEMLSLWERGHSLHPLDRACSRSMPGFPRRGPTMRPTGRSAAATGHWRNCAASALGRDFGGWARCRHARRGSNSSSTAKPWRTARHRGRANRLLSTGGLFACRPVATWHRSPANAIKMRRRGAWPSGAGWMSGQNRRRRLRLGSNGATRISTLSASSWRWPIH